jgi:hypothetical protein
LRFSLENRGCGWVCAFPKENRDYIRAGQRQSISRAFRKEKRDHNRAAFEKRKPKI